MGAGAGGPGQRLVISGLPGTGVSAPRAPVRPTSSPLLGAAFVPLLR